APPEEYGRNAVAQNRRSSSPRFLQSFLRTHRPTAQKTDPCWRLSAHSYPTSGLCERNVIRVSSHKHSQTLDFCRPDAKTAAITYAGIHQSRAVIFMSLQQTFGDLRAQLAKRIIGQDKLVDRLLIALLADGHLLVEGAPGLAKTTAVKALADHLEGDFHRIQFTPDLLPSDVTGSEIYRAETGTFEFQRGPIFHNLVLADEINRAPAKVQSALLEAMGERQISVGM